MPARKALRVAWEGHSDAQAQGSWAMVNTRLLPHLALQEGLQVETWAPAPDLVGDTAYDVWVTHYYPPLAGLGSWALPPTNARRWVVWLAWEHGRVPTAWEATWRAGRVFEVWVPSDHTRRLVLASTGLDPAKVVVVPYGVDCDVYSPQAQAWPRESDAFRVLYVGGAIWRKGADLAVEAFARAFQADDPVRLVLKLQGAQTFYRDAPPLRAPDGAQAPWQVIPGDDYTDEQMAGLYAGCDVVCQPYRAEGFCLPLLEGMASGKPVVYPAEGPAPMYVPEGAGIAVPVMGGEPDATSVAMALRWLWRHPDERAHMGEIGRSAARMLDWSRRAEDVASRLKRVAGARGAGDAFTPPPEPPPGAPG